ncbi:hypothetical protein ALI144C_34945 [Actinosynnema sp. ALI-1.44]|uniref:hypothetical protein n=1 Tax=Actinosynnema sp. ALI-1.44 TaxID=1933779 RepID=UPI00097BD684|nr:hypothetical protein [Actinosynnema sp. ALI-1.44]ONI77263.1 hypothetical protein ALI144C_34945 [Actinosynnema sp. ALI-1.44]
MPVGEQGPETADQQIRFAVTVDETLRAAAGVFGIDLEPQTAGGGGNGKWVFTSLDQLDGLIKKWTDMCDAIDHRRALIQQAEGLVMPPAEDIMSRFQANTLKNSMDAMKQHADSMHAYAATYLQKLHTTRSAYVGVEGQNTRSLTEPGGG